MTLSEFKASLQGGVPPAGLTLALESLWHAARGDWDAAHALAQTITSTDGSWVHAMLHRAEGDLSNASYWYARAGKSATTGPSEHEWEHLVTELLSRSESS